MQMRNLKILLSILGLFLLSFSFVACSHRVSASRVPGTYVATYPFGSGVLTLSPDGSFVQQITIQNEPPLTKRGSWTFDPQASRLTLKGFTIAVDGLGHLISGWRNDNAATASLPIDIVWLRTTI